MTIGLDFREINKTVKYPVNLLKKRQDNVGVHQRVADSL